MNYKGKLQELCQKRGYSLPKYESSFSGPPHNRTFISSVVVPDIDEDPASAMGKTKKLSEQGAAKAYLDWLEMEDREDRENVLWESVEDGEDGENGEEVETDMYIPPDEYEELLLVDLENCPDISSLKERNMDNTRIIGFMSDTCSMYRRLGEYQRFMEVEVIHSNQRDAADILLIFTLGQITEKLREKVLITIVSRDRFVGGLIDVVRSRTNCPADYRTSL